MRTHADTPGTPGLLVRTGKLVPFLEVPIGQPFWAHGAVWTRTAYDAATRLEGAATRGSCCNFLIDAIDREVEALDYATQAEGLTPCTEPPTQTAPPASAQWQLPGPKRRATTPA